MESLLMQLAELIARVQGPVWDAAMRQVVVNRTINMVFAILSAVICVIGAILWKKEDSASNQSPSDTLWCFFGLLSVFTFVACIVLSVTTYNQFANPEWVAIKLLLGR